MITRLFEKLDRWAESRAIDKHIIVKIFLAALAARLLLIFLHYHINLISDMLGYHEAAVSLLEYGEFRVKGRLSATRPPLYSIYLFIIYYLFGTGNFFVVRISQCLIDAFTVVLTFKLAEKVFHRKAAVWASLLYAFYPAAIGFCDQIMTETFFTFLFTAVMYLLIDIPEGKYKTIFAAALLMGAATLTRTVLFMFPVFIFLYYLVFSKKRFSYLPKLALLGIVFWLTLVPWMARNERVFGKPILTTKSGVDFFLYNHNPFMNIVYNYSLEGKDVFKDITPWKLSEMERDQICRQKAIEWITENPGLFLFKGVRMQWNFFGVEREYIWSLIAGFWGNIPRWQLAASFFIFAPWIYIVMPLFIWGVVYSWKRYPKTKNLLLIIAYFLAITFVYFGFTRHRSPLNPIMMAFGGFALASYAEILKDLHWKKLMQNRRALIAISIFLFFVIGWILEIVIDGGSLLHLGFTHSVWKSFGIGG